MADKPTLTGELDRLLDELRRDGYNIGLQEHIDVHDLLVSLEAQNRLPESLEGLAPMVGPLVCNTPQQQSDFHHRFALWAADAAPRLEEELLAPAPKSATVEIRDHLEEESQKARRVRRWSRWAQWTVFLVAAAAVLATEIRDRSGTSGGVQPDTTASAPAPDSTGAAGDTVVAGGGVDAGPSAGQRALATISARFSETVQTVMEVRWILLGAVGLGLLVLLVQWAYGYWLAGRFLSTRLVRDGPSMTHLMTRGEELPPFDTKRLFRAAQNFRLHRRIGALYLDAEATVQKSVENAGWYSPVERHRLTVPEYLVLVDRSAARDHQARIFSRLTDWLTRQGVFIARYSFDGDPRVCRAEEVRTGPRRKARTLVELSALHPYHRLAVFSSAAHLVDPFTGLMESWTEAFEPWPLRALLTPDRPEHWGDAERQLSEAGWLVYPGTEEGLHALVERPDQAHPWERSSRSSWSPPLPSLIQAEPERWLDRRPPDPETIEELVDDLSVYLDEDGFAWLSACAVFPELHWNLTVAVGRGLKGRDGGRMLDEDRLVALARLPWFRVGHMPVWLRDRLLHGLTAERRQEVKSVLDGVLEAKVIDPERAEVLEIALQNRIPDLGRRILRRIQGNEPEDSPLREQLFASFMGTRLAFALTDGVRRLLRPSGRSLALSREERRLVRTTRVLLVLASLMVLVAMIVGNGSSELVAVLVAIGVPAGALSWVGRNRWAGILAAVHCGVAITTLGLGAAVGQSPPGLWLPAWGYAVWLAATAPLLRLAWRGWSGQEGPTLESRAGRAVRWMGLALAICIVTTAGLMLLLMALQTDIVTLIAPGAPVQGALLLTTLALPGTFALGLSLLPVGRIARAPRARATGLVVAAAPLAALFGVAGWTLWIVGTAGLALGVRRRGPAPWDDTGWPWVGWGRQRRSWVAAVSFALVGAFIVLGAEYLAGIFPPFSLFSP